MTLVTNKELFLTPPTQTSSLALFDCGPKRKHKTLVDTKSQTCLISLAKEK